MRPDATGANHSTAADDRTPAPLAVARLSHASRGCRFRRAHFVYILMPPNSTGDDVMEARSVLIGALWVLVSTATVGAQVTVDITKITCRQFLIGKLIPTNSMSLWFSGYYSGKRNDTMIELEAIQPNVEKVKDYCRQHQDTELVKAVENVFGPK
jgi:acid stress chaperone HdeB